MPKFTCNRIKAGSNIVPAKLDVGKQKLVLLVLKESFSFEKKSLLQSSSISNTSTILKLSPFIGSNGLLRAKGRTHTLEFATFGAILLVILDARHPLVHFFLQQLNERQCRHGVEFSMALTQQNLSIQKLHTTLKSMQLKYVRCRIRKAETLTPIKTDVSRESLAFRSAQFSNTGIDDFGRLCFS